MTKAEQEVIYSFQCSRFENRNDYNTPSSVRSTFLFNKRKKEVKVSQRTWNEINLNP